MRVAYLPSKSKHVWVLALFAMYATDIRTDGQMHHLLPLPYWCGGIIIIFEISEIVLLCHQVSSGGVMFSSWPSSCPPRCLSHVNIGRIADESIPAPTWTRPRRANPFPCKMEYSAARASRLNRCSCGGIK